MPCPHLVFSDRAPYQNGIYLCECPDRKQVPYAPSLAALRSHCLTERNCKICRKGEGCSGSSTQVRSCPS